MCGRYSFIWLINKLQDQFGPLKYKSDGTTKYNVAPGSKNPIILEDENQTQIIDFFNWGLVPHWAKGKPNFGFKTINARVESVEEKAMYKKPFLEKRCIVPASGYYEWKGTAGQKQPYYIHPKKLSYFGFAGLYESWESDSGNKVNSYTIITGPASKKISEVHDRMPVILKEKNYSKWVSKEQTTSNALKKILADFEDNLSYYKVSTSVNNSRNESSDLIKPDSQKTLF